MCLSMLCNQDARDACREFQSCEEGVDCIVSFPGKYATGWDALTSEKTHGQRSVACVFLQTPEEGLGKHCPDPDADELGKCYCSKLYGPPNRACTVIWCAWTSETHGSKLPTLLQ